MEKLPKRFSEIADEARAVQEEIDVLMEVEPFDQEAFDDANTRATALADEKKDLELRLANYEARQAQLEDVRKYAENAGNRERIEDKNVRVNKDLGDVFDLNSVRGFGEDRTSELRTRALNAVEATSDWEFEDGASDKADRSKERITRILERKDDKDGRIAQLILTTGNPIYKRAWAKGITDRKELLTGQEKELLLRAMSLTNNAGGFAVPFPIDPTLIQLGDGAAAGVRNFARVEQITTDTWQGVASTELTASWDGEAAEVSDDTTTFSQPQITAHKAQAFVPASIEIAGDYPNLVGDLGELFADAKFRLEATAFATGTGTNQPVGIVTALDGTSSDTSTATTDVFAIADVYATFENTGPRYRMAGVGSQAWCSNIAILNDIRQFGTANNYHGFTVDLTEAGVPAILGRPWFEMSAMDGVINTMAENNILVFGDWRSYVIVDRVGFSVEFIPHLFNTANNLPSGQRGYYAYWRVGADSVNDGAFTLLNAT